jgi:LacI family transcriptional regulator, purine nucleotide synthesis repressor
MQSQLHTLGYSAPLYSYGYGGRWEIDNQLPLLRSLLASRPRAVICNLSGVMPELMEHLEEYRAGGGILVCYGYDEIAPIACDQVVFDVEHGFYLAARHLFQMGHRQLGAFDVGQRVFGGKALNGIMRAASESGADVRNEWLFGNTGEFRYEEEGILLAQKYLALKEKPSAMCIANDYAAVGFMCEVWKTGLRIPDDLSVVGHDDDAIAPCGIVPLTTVNYAVDAMAQHVIRFLRRRIEEEYQGPAECLTIRGTIVKRGSVTPPKTEKPALG